MRRIILIFCLLIGSVVADVKPATTDRHKAPIVVTPAKPNSQPIIVVGDKEITFDLSVSGKAPITVQWYKNNVAIAGATSTKLVIAKTAVGMYYLKATNSNGSTLSKKVRVTTSSDPNDADYVVIVKDI